MGRVLGCSLGAAHRGGARFGTRKSLNKRLLCLSGGALVLGAACEVFLPPAPSHHVAPWLQSAPHRTGSSSGTGHALRALGTQRAGEALAPGSPTRAPSISRGQPSRRQGPRSLAEHSDGLCEDPGFCGLRCADHWASQPSNALDSSPCTWREQSTGSGVRRPLRPNDSVAMRDRAQPLLPGAWEPLSAVCQASFSLWQCGETRVVWERRPVVKALVHWQCPPGQPACGTTSSGRMGTQHLASVLGLLGPHLQLALGDLL